MPGKAGRTTEMALRAVGGILGRSTYTDFVDAPATWPVFNGNLVLCRIIVVSEGSNTCTCIYSFTVNQTLLAFFINLQRIVIGMSATLTGR